MPDGKDVAQQAKNSFIKDAAKAMPVVEGVKGAEKVADNTPDTINSQKIIKENSKKTELDVQISPAVEETKIKNITEKTQVKNTAEETTVEKEIDSEGGKETAQSDGNTSKINQLPLAKPGEDLYVGTYNKSSYWNKKTGLNKTHTPHHAVQDAVSTVSHGKGITINLRKDIHLQTETYGRKRHGLTNRQNLAADVMELRVLLQNNGYDRSVINAQLSELIKQNKALGGFEK